MRTNLIESYSQLIQFGEKWLPDKFYLENSGSVSLRGKILREAIGNLLIHREFTSSYVARFVIEKERIVVDNSNRSCHHGNITPQNLMPQAKNPLIADFFKEIGRADELGSGVRNLYKFVRLYSGKDPMLLDEDIFTLIIPLDDTFSPESAPIPEIRTAKQRDGLLAQSILERLRQDDTLSREALASAISSSPQIVKGILNKLRQDGKLKRIGPAHGGHWVVVEE